MQSHKILRFRQSLSRWYESHGRHSLPWRTSRDPYAIYISEIMLQQTQVKTVLERFYHPFLTRFPTLKSLAEAPEKEVLAAWQGLGYYSRARNLHRAAKLSRGSLPETVDELLTLPGIGKNTAHAIAAFAYHQPVAVMEANVKRVISRLYALKQPTPQLLWKKASELLNEKSPFEYNQAMMDLGAMICSPRAPDCQHCPASIVCEGQSSPLSYPTSKRKKPIPLRKKKIIVSRSQSGAYHATPRSGKFLAGLYHFSEYDGSYTVPAKAKKLGVIRQSYSHFHLEAEVHLVSSLKKTQRGWYHYEELKKLPMSRAEEKIVTLLGRHL